MGLHDPVHHRRDPPVERSAKIALLVDQHLSLSRHDRRKSEQTRRLRIDLKVE